LLVSEIELYNKALADNPMFGPAHLGLSAAYLGARKYQQGIQEYQSAAQTIGDKNLAEVAAAMDAGFRSGGWPKAVQNSIEVSLAQRKAKTGYVSPYVIAEAYADLGDKDHAFEWLSTAYQEHDPLLVGLRTDFSFDSVHSDPRYAELVRKVGFPQ
jgi:tetratricopeptide (TPR) repeat protein